MSKDHERDEGEENASRRGATQAELLALEQWAGRRLPQPYLALLQSTNGFEDFVSADDYLVIWPAEQVAELNDSYPVAEFAPGLFLFGSDGSDAGYAFDTRTDRLAIQRVPFMGMCLEDAEEVGSDFDDFMKRLREGGLGQ